MTEMRAFRIYRALLLSCALLASPAWAVTCRVTTTGSQFNDGSSWAAPTTLKQALFAFQVCTEVWVAKGVYKPGLAGQSETTFRIEGGTEVYGGFAGNETVREQRDPKLNLTVLSGDIDSNDVAVDGVVEDADDIVGTNTGPVVTMENNVGSDTVLDGFTITAGFRGLGGGMLCGASTGFCQPMLSNLVFSGNSARFVGGQQRGGALANFAVTSGNASPTLIDVVFRGNGAADGGAIFNFALQNANASPSMTRVLFIDNRADTRGGAIANNPLDNGTASPTLERCTFIGNTSGDTGGAIANNPAASNAVASPSINRSVFIGNSAVTFGGAMVGNAQSTGSVASPSISNSTFHGNSAAQGGALFSSAFVGSAIPTLNNVTLSANQASGLGGGIVSADSGSGVGNIVVHNSIFWGNQVPLGQQGPEVYLNGAGAVTFDHSIVKGSGGSAAWNPAFGTNAGGNLDADPLLSALGEDFGGTQTMRPATGSPAINAGLGCAGVDQRGIGRPQGPACDIGAVEVVTIDLISHDGFESSCSLPSLTTSEFLTRVRTAIDGATICIPPYAGNVQGVDVTACFNNDCPGGTPGCPITITAAAFADGGDFGAGHFTSTGTASNVTVPVNSQFLACVYTATNITTSYSVDYFLTDDGSGGVYSGVLNGFVPAATNFTFGSPNFTCNNLANSVKDAFANQAAAAVIAARRPALEAATLDETICPVQ